LGNFLLAMLPFNHHEGLGLRSGGTLAIIFSLVCIGLAAFSFLIDFDAADQMIRAGAPEKAAWGIALGLTVTLVWLYIEILRLLSYLQSD
ncbi:MAG: Bax inhibitor-1/YccA family protein, partial [Mycobacterium sp.]|nr:Bax inhibitor-1/YccA family protein [Mycobacterium sp.]